MSTAITLPVYAASRPHHPRRSGFSLLEVAISIGIAGLALVAMEQGADDANRQVKDVAVADRLAQVYTAATQYVQANPSLASSVPVGGSVEVPVARTTPTGTIPAGSLQAQGYLPPNFVDSNAYGQNSAVIIRQPTAGNIEALVTTIGGQTIGDVDLGRIAAKIGANGGVVDNNPPPGVGAGTMLGTGGGWQEPATHWTTSGITPSVGHAVAVDYLTQVNTLQDFLYRNNIGIHEANTMHTSIDVNHNALDGVNQIDNIDHTTGANAPISVASTLSGVGGGQVQIQNGLDACTAGATGCSVTVSAKAGGFTDNGDGNLTYQGSAAGHGLIIGGAGSNLSVNGESFLNGSVLTYAGVQMQNGGTITWPGKSNAFIAPDGNPAYIDIAGGSLSVAANIWAGNGTVSAADVAASNNVSGNTVTAAAYMAAPLYYDSENESYYLQPRGTSQLNVVNANSLLSYGNVTANGTVVANNSGNGNATEFWGPGFDVSESGGTTNEALDGALNVGGDITASGTSSGNGLITTMTASLGGACSNSGEMARDASTGNLDWCKGGVWSAPAAQFQTLVAKGAGYYPGSWSQNTYGTPILVTAYTANQCLNYGIALGGDIIEGGSAATVANGQGFNPTISFIVPSGDYWTLTVSETPDGAAGSCSVEPSDAIYYSAWE